MKMFRRICIGLVLLGLLLLHGERKSRFGTVPFPSAGLAVKMDAKVSNEGDYYVDVSMPEADHALGLDAATVPCLLTVNIDGRSKDVISLTRYSEVGFSHIQYYQSDAVWHLQPGSYVIEVSSRQNCAAAIARGAAISLEQETTHLTEHYLWSVLRVWCGGLFLSLGLIGLIACEFKKV